MYVIIEDFFVTHQKATMSMTFSGSRGNITSQDCVASLFDIDVLNVFQFSIGRLGDTVAYKP